MTAYNSTRSTKSTFLESLTTTTNFELHKHNYSLTLVLSKIIVNDSKSYIHKRIKLATPQFDYADMPPGTDCPYPIRILAFFEMIRPYHVVIRI